MSVLSTVPGDRQTNQVMKAVFLWIALFLLAQKVSAAVWRPSDALLDAVRRIESADGLYTVGDNGMSLGNYQLSEAAWDDVSAWRKSRGVATFKYHRDVWSERVSRSYAADYMRLLHGQLSERLGRAPSTLEIYAAYNMGLSAFVRCGYRLTAVNFRGQDLDFAEMDQP